MAPTATTAQDGTFQTVRGRYALPRLLAERGDLRLPDLLAQLSRRCPKQGNVGVYDRCGAHFHGL